MNPVTTAVSRNRIQQSGHPPLLLYPRLPYIDISVEILELNFLAPAVDGAAHIFVDLYPIFAAPAAIVFHGLLRRIGLHLNIEVPVDLAIISTQPPVGFQVRGKSHIDIAVQRPEGHRLLWR